MSPSLVPSRNVSDFNDSSLSLPLFFLFTGWPFVMSEQSIYLTGRKGGPTLETPPTGRSYARLFHYYYQSDVYGIVWKKKSCPVIELFLSVNIINKSARRNYSYKRLANSIRVDVIIRRGWQTRHDKSFFMLVGYYFD